MLECNVISDLMLDTMCLMCFAYDMYNEKLLCLLTNHLAYICYFMLLVAIPLGLKGKKAT